MRYEFYQQNEITMIKQNAKLNFCETKKGNTEVMSFSL